MKYLLPLFLISFGGFAAEPPVVKSKAAQELLKHPEFKKAMEAAPEFTKAVLKELDKHAPEMKKKPSLDGVGRWVEYNGVKFPQFNALDRKSIKEAGSKFADFYDGWTYEKWKAVYGDPISFALIPEPGPTFWAGGRAHYALVAKNPVLPFFNPETKRNMGTMRWMVDKETMEIAAVLCSLGDLTLADMEERLKCMFYTPTAKKLGYKMTEIE